MFTVYVVLGPGILALAVFLSKCKCREDEMKPCSLQLLKTKIKEEESS